MLPHARRIVHKGETYHWVISCSRERFAGWSPQTITLTVQAPTGALFRTKVRSKRWGPEHDDGCPPMHKASFTPSDVALCIAAAKAQGWPSGKPREVYALTSPDLKDYV